MNEEIKNLLQNALGDLSFELGILIGNYINACGTAALINTRYFNMKYENVINPDKLHELSKASDMTFRAQYKYMKNLEKAGVPKVVLKLIQETAAKDSILASQARSLEGKKSYLS